MENEPSIPAVNNEPAAPASDATPSNGEGSNPTTPTDNPAATPANDKAETPVATDKPTPGDEADPTVDDNPDADDVEEEPTTPKDPPAVVNEDGTVVPEVYAADQLQEIAVRGRVGNGKVQEYKVKLAGDLPQGFKFADGREQAIALEALGQNAALYQRAINDAETYNDQTKADNSRKETAARQKSEIEQLQKDGKLPKFGVKPGDAKFMDDDGAKRVQAVLTHMDETNEQWAKAGLPDRITSVSTALMLLEAKEALEARDKRESDIQARRDAINGGVGNGGPTGPAAPAPVNIYPSVHAAAQNAKRKLSQN